MKQYRRKFADLPIGSFFQTPYGESTWEKISARAIRDCNTLDRLSGVRADVPVQAFGQKARGSSK